MSTLVNAFFICSYPGLGIYLCVPKIKFLRFVDNLLDIYPKY